MDNAPGPALIRIEAPLGLSLVAEQVQEDRHYEAVVIKAGVFTPGMGNPDASRIRFTEQVLERIAESLEGKKVNLDHEQDTQAEVGFVKNVRFQEGAIRATLVLQATRSRFTDAVSFVEGRLKAGAVPNVSIEVRNPVLMESDDADYDLDLIDAELAGVSLVSTGACDDQNGCGIGLQEQTTPAEGEDNTMSDEQTPCTCDKADEAPSLHAKIAALEAEVEELREAKTAVEQEAMDLQQRVDAYHAAEVQGLREALTAAAPEDADLSAVLGCELEEADAKTIEVAIAAFKASAKTVGFKAGGRRTVEANRTDAAPDEDALRRKRIALGFSGDAPKMPRTMQRNTDELLGKVA